MNRIFVVQAVYHCTVISDKLTSLLQTFSRPELNRFRKYLQSPYLNDDEDLIRLFEQFNEALRLGTAKVAELDKVTLWKALFPKKKFDDLSLRRLNSELTQRALHFLALDAQKPFTQEQLLLLQGLLSGRNLQKQLDWAERQLQRKMDEESRFSPMHYLTLFRFHWNVFERTSRQMGASDYIEKLAPADHALDCFYIIQKQKEYVAWLVYRGFRTTTKEIKVIPGFWEYVQGEPFNQVPLIVLYTKLIRCLQEPETEQHFEDLKDYLEKHSAQVGAQDQRECYHIAQNYCAFKINQGKTDYYRQSFDLYKTMMEKGLILEKELLPERVFKNVITTGLGVGEYAWVERFIREYNQYLPDDVRENARTYNLSYLYFHQKRYPEVIELLRNVEYSDVIYALGAKLTLLRTYYELDEYKALDSLIDSFKIYLRRNKELSTAVKREYDAYLNTVRKLSTLHPSDRKGRAQLREKFLATARNMPKKWLLEKMEGG